LIVIIFEAYNHYRQILMDGRPLPEITQPAYMGHSVGKWDADTLVVDTTGFNDRGWLDDGGHPQTEALHVTERCRRRDFGHIALQVTIDDPKAYTRPWIVNLGLNFLPDEELIEGICEKREGCTTHGRKVVDHQPGCCILALSWRLTWAILDRLSVAPSFYGLLCPHRRNG
jgi:hypothetical protein